MLFENIKIADEESVGGEDDVMVGDGVEMIFAVGTMEEEHFEIGCEFFGFGLPVSNDRGGSNDQAGTVVELATCHLSLNMSEGLEGFSETHIIGENTVE